MTSSSNSSLAGTMAGISSGALSALILQPLDVLTTRIIQKPLSNTSHSRILQASRAVLQEHGFKGLWSGVIPATIRVAGGAGVYFSILSVIYPSVNDRVGKASNVDSKWYIAPVSGIIARATATVAMSPVTLLKTRAEASGVSSLSSWKLFANWSKIVHEEGGWRALYKGLIPVMLRDMPYSALSFTFYIRSRNYLRSISSKEDEQHSYWIDFVAGMIAGGGSTAITHPGEVLKVKHQLDKSAVHRRILDTIQQIYREEGIRGFLKGYIPRIIRRSLSQSVSWGAYGFFLSIFAKD